MTKYFSYIDTALRIIQINAETKGLDTAKFSKVIAGLEGYPETNIELRGAIVDKQLADNPELFSTLAHESHHYWQTFHYPFLYFLSWLEYNAFVSRWKFIRTGYEIDVEKNKRALFYASSSFALNWNNGRLVPDNKIDKYDDYSNNLFSLTDLLEDVTSLFQYRLTTENPSSDGYFRWIQNPRTRAYKRLCKFLTPVLGNDFVYHFLPILCQLAFYTTDPPVAFCSLVNICIGYGFTIDWGFDDFVDLKRIFLNMYPREELFPEKYVSVGDIPFTILDKENYLNPNVPRLVQKRTILG